MNRSPLLIEHEEEGILGQPPAQDLRVVGGDQGLVLPRVPARPRDHRAIRTPTAIGVDRHSTHQFMHLGSFFRADLVEDLGGPFPGDLPADDPIVVRMQVVGTRAPPFLDDMELGSRD